MTLYGFYHRHLYCPWLQTLKRYRQSEFIGRRRKPMTKQKLLQRLAAEVGSVQKTILALAGADETEAAPSAPEPTAKTVSLEDIRAVLADNPVQATRTQSGRCSKSMDL
jgi:hypothetical protein